MPNVPLDIAATCANFGCFFLRHPVSVAAEGVAAALADSIGRCLAAQSRVIFLSSGGKSPGDVLTALSRYPLDWSRVIFSVTDERMVPLDHPASNFGLLMRSLDPAVVALAKFVPLWIETDLSAAGACRRLTEELGNDPLFDVALLGMGVDGHMASLFPSDLLRSQGLVEASESFQPALPDPLPAEAPWPRITVTLKALCRTRFPHLLVFGQEKEDALADFLVGLEHDVPVAACHLRHGA